MSVGFSLPFVEVYAKRTRQVFFVARCIARHLGTATIGLEAMLLALIYEDQGRIEEVLVRLSDSPNVPRSLRSQKHQPFFSAKMAADLIRKTDSAAGRSKPLPLTAELPMSPDLKHVLERAGSLMRSHKRNRVLPLHALAALLAEPPNSAAGTLRQAGFTYEGVKAAIARGADKG